MGIGILLVGPIFAVIMIIVLVCEQKDKQHRAQQGLPPRKYHDITDYSDLEVHLMLIEDLLRSKK